MTPGHALKKAEDRLMDDIMDIDEYLDAHPCPHCGRHYDDHFQLTRADLDHARNQGAIVSICEVHTNSSSSLGLSPILADGDSRYFCVVDIPPQDPADEDFMRSISS